MGGTNTAVHRRWVSAYPRTLHTTLRATDVLMVTGCECGGCSGGAVPAEAQAPDGQRRAGTQAQEAGRRASRAAERTAGGLGSRPHQGLRPMRGQPWNVLLAACCTLQLIYVNVGHQVSRCVLVHAQEGHGGHDF